jgi:hypothetical protein
MSQNKISKELCITEILHLHNVQIKEYCTSSIFNEGVWAVTRVEQYI